MIKVIWQSVFIGLQVTAGSAISRNVKYGYYLLQDIINWNYKQNTERSRFVLIPSGPVT